MIFDLGTNNTLIEYYWDDELNRRTAVHKHEPYFYCLTEELDRLPKTDAIVRVEHDHTSLFGDDCTKIVVEHPSVVLQLRDRFSKTFEADVPYLRRCVIDCLSEIKNKNSVTLYFDLETEVRGAMLDPGNRVLSISARDTKTQRRIVFVWTPDGKCAEDLSDLDFEVHLVGSEQEMLTAFATWVRRVDPSILTAWNLFGFDLPALNNRLGNENLSPYNKGDEGSVKGRIVVDLAEIYRKVVAKTNSWALKVVAESELPTMRKLELDVMPQELWESGRIRDLIVYNMRDTDIMYELDRKKNLIRYMLDIQATGIVPFEDCWATTPIVDAICFRKARPLCLPSKIKHEKPKVKGGWVGEPEVGLHENVAVFDFSGQYPSAIQTWNLSPECIDDEGDIEVGNGLRLTSKREGLLPSILVDLLKLRKSFKGVDEMKYKAIKNVVNTTYGATAYTGFRLHNSRIANAITYLGRWLNSVARRYFAEKGYPVIYGDTDSIFVKGIPYDLLPEITRELNAYINAEISKLTSRHSSVELEYETTFDILLLMGKKRYVGRKDSRIDPKQEWKTRGIEIVRTNAATLSRKIQKEIIELIFSGQLDAIDKYIQTLKETFKDLPLEELAIPMQVHTDPESTRDSPWIRAKVLAEDNGIIFNCTEPVRILYVRDACVTRKGKLDQLNEVPLHPQFDISKYAIDYEVMWDKIVVAKIEDILAVVGKVCPVFKRTLADAMPSAQESSSAFNVKPLEFKGTLAPKRNRRTLEE